MAMGVSTLILLDHRAMRIGVSKRSFARRSDRPVRRPRAYLQGYAQGLKNAPPADDGSWPWGPRYRRIDFDAGWEDARAELRREWLAQWG